MNEVFEKMQELDSERRKLNVSCSEIAREIGKKPATVQKQFADKKVSYGTYISLKFGFETVMEKRKKALDKIGCL